jgi:large subunit ribosomal protein L34
MLPAEASVLYIIAFARNEFRCKLALHVFGCCRKRARVSGFRARMATPGGRKVLAARRKKNRKVLVPASVPKRKM